MKNQFKTILRYTLMTILGLSSIYTCEKDINSDGEPITNDFRVLQVKVGNSVVSGVIGNFSPEGQLQLVFSHAIDKSIFESALTISPAASSQLTYDESNSIVTLGFTSPLQYQTDYVLTLPGGTYGTGGETLDEEYQLQFSTKPFSPPAISLSVATLDFYEGDEFIITLSLSESVLVDISFDLVLGGTSEKDLDYSIDRVNFTIPAGELSATATVTILQDENSESLETLTIGVENLVNATFQASQLVNINVNDLAPSLELRGVMELNKFINGADGQVRAVHLKVLEDIEDLSIYGVEVASNGAAPNPADIDFLFPAGTATKGQDIFVVRDVDLADAQAFFEGCFDNFIIFETSRMTQNGDDAILLYKNEVAIESFGEPGVDGTGTYWEYSDSWAYKLAGEWLYAGPQAVVFAETGTNSTIPASYPFCVPLQLQGVSSLLWDGSGSNGGKMIHVRANRDIADLSQYGLGVANNGGGTDGEEFTFPAIEVKAGAHILVAREPETLSSYFGSCFNGYDQVFQGDFVSQNGDDAIELFFQGTVIETFGDANVDGTGQPWEYSGAWAYRTPTTWINGPLDCAATNTSNSSSTCPYPFCD